jgi:hypothetical protein
MAGHALLSPSSASRWLECPPSARLESSRPDKAGEAADEGTLAHKLSELLISLELGLITKTIFNKEFKKVESNKLYTESMLEYCDQFCVFVMQQYHDAKVNTVDAHIQLEQRLDMTDYVPEGYGTGDVIIVSDQYVEIIDLKYGKGILVEATDNKQMMLYGLGALKHTELLFDPKIVRMTIYQPRIDNYSTWEIAVDKLKRWAENTLTTQAQLAWAGEGDFKPGAHCHFCKVKTTCKANADYQMELAKYEFSDPSELSHKELADIFLRASSFKNWINAVEADMLSAALNDGIKYPGLKLVQGRSNRTITEQEKVTKILAKAFDEDDYLSPRKLLGITVLEKNIGKKELNQKIGKYVLKPEGKPTLVSAKDNRAEYHSTDAAVKDFQ